MPFGKMRVNSLLALAICAGGVVAPSVVLVLSVNQWAFVLYGMVNASGGLPMKPVI
ncbi:MAG: hypothetical protein P8I27_10945 [Pirellulaceae bacterium]|nr:hypothetical protein [Pirellulaceae bacterium]